MPFIGIGIAGRLVYCGAETLAAKVRGGAGAELLRHDLVSQLMGLGPPGDPSLSII